MDEKMQAEVARILGCDANDLEADGTFELIDGVIELYRFNRSEIRNMPVASERRKQFLEFDAALSIILAKKPAVELILSGTREYEKLLHVAGLLQNFLRPVLEEKLKRGPDPDDRMWLIGRLAEIFQRATGKTITNTYDPYEGRFSGEFFTFARTVLSKADFLDDALGGAIRDWCRKEMGGKNE